MAPLFFLDRALPSFVSLSVSFAPYPFPLPRALPILDLYFPCPAFDIRPFAITYTLAYTLFHFCRDVIPFAIIDGCTLASLIFFVLSGSTLLFLYNRYLPLWLTCLALFTTPSIYYFFVYYNATP